MHWANKEQYYTKSGENFSNYGFKLDDGRSVKFKLVTADTAKDNRKDNDKDRLFVLIESQTRIQINEDGEEYELEIAPITEVEGELILSFDYKAMPKGSKQESLISKAVHDVLADPIVKSRWAELGRREPTEKNPQRTLLEKCLVSYTTKNLADYFIHKDLDGFLRRELDFYIKNEVINLDDVGAANKFADIEKSLRAIQTLRAIATDLISFLSQLENFQKRLWLKKKFVISTNYCVTLDRLSKKLFLDIAANKKQWEQWSSLGMLSDSKPDLFAGGEKSLVEFLE
jgi:adenine-specific DNA-methyltransferase